MSGIESRKRSKNPFLYYVVGVPLIWLMIIPVAVCDIFLELYHRICFPIFGIPYVKHSHYIRITDRTKLPYLSLPEKLGCAYCGYVNGWLHYASTIAGRTENYFCAIMHLEGRGYTFLRNTKSHLSNTATRRRFGNATQYTS